MLGINDAAIFIIQTLGSLYLLIVLMRFILQLVRANFYNPLCQFVDVLDGRTRLFGVYRGQSRFRQPRFCFRKYHSRTFRN